MTVWGRGIGLAIAVAATACLNDPAAPAAYRLEVRPDTIRFAALQDTAHPLVLERRATAPPTPLFIGTYHILDTTVATASPAGLIISRSPGATRLVVRSPHGASDTAVVLVTQAVAELRSLRDTVTLAALDAVESVGVVALDSLGSAIEGATLQYRIVDTAVATVTETGEVRARANGTTALIVSQGDQSASVVVRVAQRVSGIATAADTIRFTALGQTVADPAVPVDSLGHPVSGTPGHLSVVDTSVLTVNGLSIRSKRTGMTHVQLDVGGWHSDQVAIVEQAPARIVAAFTDGTTMRSVAQDSSLGLICEVVDANGFALPVTPAVAASGVGHWTGSSCSNLRLHTSGFDTLHVTYDSVATAIPVVLAVRPIVGPVVPLQVDQLPPNTFAWSPTARLNSQGQIELYFAGYSEVPDSDGDQRADLYRLVSADGQHFSYDGVALARDPNGCGLDGSGIENVSIVQRSDGPGWRMFYAGGSLGCYGWQVLSATSTDERNWTKESGVRIGNGGPVPPTAPGYVPWPAGEGMVTDQLPDGTWRMTVGTYEPVTPPEDKFQITEWRSTDQLTWSYLRTLLSTRDLPPEGQRSAYSPTLAEIAPGLWRMIFTADDRNQPGGRSRLWSAVSTDRVHWQLEGEILGAPGLEYFYSTLVGDRLFSIQAPQGDVGTTLVGMTLEQP